MKSLLLTFVGLISIVFTLSAQLNITQLGYLSYDEELSDIWGYVDTAGNEYALVGTNNGISIVDITNPVKPVEVYYDSGAYSIWRDIKVWEGHAYVTNETKDGLKIIDLSGLPDVNSITIDYFTGNSSPFSQVHNLFIDENGICYLFGSNFSNGGAIMLDLNTNPKVPFEVGVVSNFYLHDGFVRNDTLWGSAVYAGLQIMVDVSDKQNPSLLATFSTPGNFTHNCWISKNSDLVFTTDEIDGGYITSFDVSDFSNIQEVDRFRKGYDEEPIPHNTFFIDGFLVTSYYSEGINILDVSEDGRLVEVGNFETSPKYDTYFHGAWGVYPFLPSGNIIVSDIEEGLYILDPEYKKASYLFGRVKDKSTGVDLINCKVEISGGYDEYSSLLGYYSTGTSREGFVNIKFSKKGYKPLEVKNFEMFRDSTVILDVELEAIVAGIENEKNVEPITLKQNPVMDIIKLNINSPSIIGKEFKVIDIQGKTIYHSTISDIGFVSIPFNYSSGTYFIVLNDFILKFQK